TPSLNSRFPVLSNSDSGADGGNMALAKVPLEPRVTVRVLCDQLNWCINNKKAMKKAPVKKDPTDDEQEEEEDEEPVVESVWIGILESPPPAPKEEGPNAANFTEDNASDYDQDKDDDEWVRSHIAQLHNTLGDGHCGFRSAAVSLGWGEEGWDKVRKAMLFVFCNWPVYRDEGYLANLADATPWPILNTTSTPSNSRPRTPTNG
ncbi:hypothetical protein H4Q26_015531, partial [Puccinia striiformis f. sp. tritici PST-130]